MSLKDNLDISLIVLKQNMLLGITKYGTVKEVRNVNPRRPPVVTYFTSPLFTINEYSDNAELGSNYSYAFFLINRQY